MDPEQVRKLAKDQFLTGLRLMRQGHMMTARGLAFVEGAAENMGLGDLAVMVRGATGQSAAGMKPVVKLEVKEEPGEETTVPKPPKRAPTATQSVPTESGDEARSGWSRSRPPQLHRSSRPGTRSRGLSRRSNQ